MPFTFSWDLNPVALVALAGGGWSVIQFWFLSGKKADDALKDAAEAMESARQAHEKVALLQAAMNAHQITQAERLVSREVLREVEGRLAGSIKEILDRVDGLVKELIKQRQTGG